MLMIVGLILSAAWAFAATAVAGFAVALVCGFGVLPFDCRIWLGLTALAALAAGHVVTARRWSFAPPADDAERAYRKYMRIGGVLGVGLALLLSLRLAPWIGALAGAA